MNTIKLDKWDHAVIYYVKQDQNSTIEGVRQIWAERCGLELEDVRAVDVMNHFMPILVQLFSVRGNFNYHIAEFMRDCSPDNAWKYGMNERVDKPHNPDEEYFNRVLAVICSRLCLTEVKYLEGFDEYFAQRKANSVLEESD